MSRVLAVVFYQRLHWVYNPKCQIQLEFPALRGLLEPCFKPPKTQTFTLSHPKKWPVTTQMTYPLFKGCSVDQQHQHYSGVIIISEPQTSPQIYLNQHLHFNKILWWFAHPSKFEKPHFVNPWDCREIKSVNPKGNQPWIFTGKTDAEAEAPILGPPDAKNQLIGKDPDAGKDWGQEEKGTPRGWDGWMASPTQWTWVWANSGR